MPETIIAQEEMESVLSRTLNYRDLIRKAWVFTAENKKIMLFYSFIPSLLTTLIGIIFFGYQFFAFKQSTLFSHGEHGRGAIQTIVHVLANFFRDYPHLLISAIILAAIIIVLYLLLPTLCEGGLIQLIARKHKGEAVRVIEGISFGLLVFLPLFEYTLFISGFSFIGVLTEASFVIRNLGTETFRLTLPFFILMTLVGLIVSLLLTYTEFFIVLERKKVLTSMWKSAALMILSWQHTFLIGVLMLIISIRIVVNLVIILLVPALIILSAGFLATITLTKIGIAIGFAIGVIALLFAAYFNGILNMFATAVWTFTFIALREQKRTKEMIET